MCYAWVAKSGVKRRRWVAWMLCALLPVAWTTTSQAVQPDYRLRIAAYEFDPRQGPPAGIPDDLLFVPDTSGLSYWLIQFQHALKRADRTRLQKEFGLQLAEYFPKFAFLEKIDEAKLTALKQDPLFRATTPFQPAFKISPQIGRTKFVTPARLKIEGLLLRASLFADADPKQVVAQLIRAKAVNPKLLNDQQRGGVNQIVFTVPGKQSLSAVATLQGIRWIEEVGEIIVDNANTAGTLQSGTTTGRSIWTHGLHGEGQIISVLDQAPIDINHCSFRDAMPNTPGPTHRKVVAIRNAAGTFSTAFLHPTQVAGCVAADDFASPGTAPRRGGAWAARLVSANYHDIELGFSTLLGELQAFNTLGATIHTNSWHENAGDPSVYNTTAAVVDNFMWQHEDHLVLGSAGNSGDQQGPPGTAKNALCVAASKAPPHEMMFGSGGAGPTADGRRKPDVMAPGCGMLTARAGSTCTQASPAGGCASSFATPHVAAAAALVRQYYSEGWYPSGTKQACQAFTPSGALIKATLVNATRDMTGVAGYPNDQEGWGIVHLESALFFSGDTRNLFVVDKRHEAGLDTDDQFVTQVRVASDTEPLKITLAWSDPAPSPGASLAAVHNLDLTVTAPGGAKFLGNHFVAGSSAVGGAADAINNTEMVLVDSPTIGCWTITVTGTDVSQSPTQGFALLATGEFAPHVPASTGK